MTTVYAIFALLFIAAGILLLLGRGLSLIAGYNTLPAEAKAKIDVHRLGRFTAFVMFSLSVCMLLCMASDLFFLDWLYFVGIGLLFVVAISAIVVVNSKDRFLRKPGE